MITPRPQLASPRNRYAYFPDTAEVPEAQAVNIRNRSYTIGALVDIPAPGAQGVLFAHGSRFGGHALYIKDNRLHYVNNFVGMMEQKIDGTQDIPTGREPDPFRLVRQGRRGPARRVQRDPVPVPRGQEGRRRPDQDPAREVSARGRGPVRRPRQRRATSQTTTRARLPGVSPAARSSGSRSTSAASLTSTWSARPRRCWRGNRDSAWAASSEAARPRA